MSEKKITNSADKAADQAAEKAAAKPAAKTSSKPAAKRGRPAKSKKAEKDTKEHKERKERIFALDIGTRSVIGIVAEKEAQGLKIVATFRQEHKTRAMLDGQIHDVPQVAAVMNDVKKALAKETGPLKSAAVAAAGRALYTMTAEAEMEINGIITAEQERALDFAGVQAAQAKLAASGTVEDPTSYYCVGYSTIKYLLDGSQLKTLVGQRGKIATVNVIATFLPRQIIDSMQSALQATKLDMRALTLEPIAAINVLIPPTMRHLNLVLVDIGAGTSDVAITMNGSVTAYGMVPQAGDEITEAISQKFLLDFNVAEQLKRDVTEGKEVQFTDILGMPYDLTAQEVIEPIMPNIQNLANAIASQIMELNGNQAPQAVMLVGGGSLTPHLQELVAAALDLPENRVAVRHPETIDGIIDIPQELKAPDAVTPLGILKIASINTLHFMQVFVNEQEYSLFNFREMTISDALLNAGIQLKKLNGKPGLGVMLTINDKSKFIPGTMGTLAQLKLNGEPADLDTVIQDGSHITIEPGENGAIPEVTLADVIDVPASYTVYINDEEKTISGQWLVNGQVSDLYRILSDGDVITTREATSLGEVLRAAGYEPSGRKVRYTLNGSGSMYTISPEILLNDAPATLSTEVHEKDCIEYNAPDLPKLGDVLNISELEASIIIYYKDKEYRIPSAGVSLEVNGHPASTGTIIEEGSDIRYGMNKGAATTVSDALLAVGFEPPPASSRLRFTITVNKQPATFTDPIKNRDVLDIILEEREEHSLAAELAKEKELSAAPASEDNTANTADKPALANSLLEKLGITADDIGKNKPAKKEQPESPFSRFGGKSNSLSQRVHSIPGLTEALSHNKD